MLDGPFRTNMSLAEYEALEAKYLPPMDDWEDDDDDE